jgi:hypothetical protein
VHGQVDLRDDAGWIHPDEEVLGAVAPVAWPHHNRECTKVSFDVYFNNKQQRA